MIPLKLGTIARALGVSCPAGQADVVIKRVITDSRSVQPGDLFLAIRGPRFDGHAFVKQAIDASAEAKTGLQDTLQRWINMSCFVHVAV